jgi:hypothetical protein
MKRPEPMVACKGSLVPHPRSFIDDLGMPGHCGVCEQAVEFTRIDGLLVPKRHPAAKKRVLTGLPPDRGGGRNSFRRPK